MIHGDSPAVIRRIANRTTHDRRATVFAYLDAHGPLKLPLRWELLELLSGWDCICIVVDDFQVPGDLGYKYGDYGPGLALDVGLLAGLPLSDVALFFPQVLSVDETGHRRGWAVLARGSDVVDQLARTVGLVAAGQWSSAAGSFVGERNGCPSRRAREAPERNPRPS